MDEKTTHDYGLLIAPQADYRQLPGLPHLATDLHLKIGTLRDHTTTESLKSWRNYVGSSRVEAMTSEGLLVYCVRPARPDSVQYDEHESLGERLELVLTALQLVDFGVPMRGAPSIVTGDAASDAPFDIKSVTGLRDLSRIPSPFYASLRAFGISKGKLARPVGAWAGQWSTNVALLDGLHGRCPAILRVGLTAFLEGLRSQLLEFRIPNLVRAAECVLGVPRNEGTATFVRRALALVPMLADDPCLDGGLEQRLTDLYRLRSDCVHGKVPFDTMQSEGDERELEAARLEYVAEHLARSAILFGLRRADQPCFANRAALEREWRMVSASPEQGLPAQAASVLPGGPS